MIVGAGAVGAYLAKQVGDCEVWERSPRLAEKACSGLVSIKGLSKMDVDWKPLALNRVRGARFHAGKRTLEVSRAKPAAAVLDRLELQKTLIQDAENAGCKIRWGKAWRGERDDFVIGADGCLSTVAAACGSQRDYWTAYQVKCALRSDPDFVQLFFGDFAPGFFAWIIPYDEKNAEVGLACNPAGAGHAQECFNAFVKKHKLQLGRVRQKQAGFIPKFDSCLPTVFGNIALVGDAAGQVKATTGGGLVYGFKCAEALAEAIERDNLAHYEREWRARCERELKLHARLRGFLDRANCEKVFAALDNGAVRGALREASMDEPSVLLKKLAKHPVAWPAVAKAFLAAYF